MRPEGEAADKLIFMRFFFSFPLIVCSPGMNITALLLSGAIPMMNGWWVACVSHPACVHERSDRRGGRRPWRRAGGRVGWVSVEAALSGFQHANETVHKASPPRRDGNAGCSAAFMSWWLSL